MAGATGVGCRIMGPIIPFMAAPTACASCPAAAGRLGIWPMIRLTLPSTQISRFGSTAEPSAGSPLASTSLVRRVIRGWAIRPRRTRGRKLWCRSRRSVPPISRTSPASKSGAIPATRRRRFSWMTFHWWPHRHRPWCMSACKPRKWCAPWTPKCLASTRSRGMATFIRPPAWAS